MSRIAQLKQDVYRSPIDLLLVCKGENVSLLNTWHY